MILCDFVILCLLQMKSFPSFLTSCEVGKTSGRSPARLGLIIISTNFDQIYRTLCHQTAAPHWKKKIFNFNFAFFVIRARPFLYHEASCYSFICLRLLEEENLVALLSLGLDLSDQLTTLYKNVLKWIWCKRQFFWMDYSGCCMYLALVFCGLKHGPRIHKKWKYCFQRILLISLLMNQNVKSWNEYYKQ